MTAFYNDRKYAFRPCDTEGMTQEELQDAVTRTAHLQYEVNMTWLWVPGIGYGWEA